MADNQDLTAIKGRRGPLRVDVGTEFARVVRFAITGVAATVVYWLTTNVMFAVFAAPLILASLGGHIVAGFVSYFGHLYFSFQVAAKHAIYIPRFVIVTFFTVLYNIAVVAYLPKFGISVPLTTLLIGVTIPIINYFLNRIWVFAGGFAANLAGETL